MNPTDSFAYCATKVTSTTGMKHRLIRFGSHPTNPNNAYFEYVAILPNGFGAAANTAAFDSDGKYHVLRHGAGNGAVWVISDLHILTGYAPGQYDHASLTDFSSLPKTGNTPFRFADVGVKNISGTQYGFLLETGANPPSIMVYRVDPFQTQTFTIDTQATSGYAISSSSGWGSIWSYAGDVLAAANGGDGVWKLQLDDFDFTDTSNPITMEYVGPSQATGVNDGMNCMGLPSPYSDPLKWDCSDPDAMLPIQYLKCGTGTLPIRCHDSAMVEGLGFYKLDLSTSPPSYLSLFTIPKQQDGFQIVTANGFSISPIDSFAYQSVQLGDGTSWLIRFGSQVSSAQREIGCGIDYRKGWEAKCEPRHH